MSSYVTKEKARDIVERYVVTEGLTSSTQDLLDAGAVPRLRGYVVRPGKVSDCIYGGPVQFTKKDGTVVEAENPPLVTPDGTPIRLMVRTQRISTHDVNRGDIPFKDQILAANHAFMRELIRGHVGTSQFDIDGLPDTSVVIAAENLQQLAFENVLRAYMAKSTTSTSLYVHYMRGDREFCGHQLPDDLIPNGPLPYIMDTPSTKSDLHDESVSPAWLFDHGICTPEQYATIRIGSLAAFETVAKFLAKRNLIAVDTKTEHGINRRGDIVSQDELWTMDSSRFWLLTNYEDQRERLARGEIKELNPVSYSKEFARGFAEGEKGFTDEQRIEIAVRYIEGIQHLLGKPFVPDMRPRDERVVSGLEQVMKKIGMV